MSVLSSAACWPQGPRSSCCHTDMRCFPPSLSELREVVHGIAPAITVSNMFLFKPSVLLAFPQQQPSPLELSMCRWSRCGWIVVGGVTLSVSHYVWIQACVNASSLNGEREDNGRKCERSSCPSFGEFCRHRHHSVARKCRAGQVKERV